MALTEAFTMSAVTIGSSEYSIPGATTSGVPTSQTDDGFYTLVLDAFNMALGDEYIVRFYEKALSGGTQRLLWSVSLAHVQSSLLITPSIPLLHGWDCTIAKVAGSDRAFSGSIRKVA